MGKRANRNSATERHACHTVIKELAWLGLAVGLGSGKQIDVQYQSRSITLCHGEKVMLGAL